MQTRIKDVKKILCTTGGEIHCITDGISLANCMILCEDAIDYIQPSEHKESERDVKQHLI